MSADPVPYEIDLLAGTWYSREPHDAWTWMREHRPRLLRRAATTCGRSPATTTCSPIEKDPATFSSRRSPRPHGDPLPMMISMDDPQHQRRRSLVNRGFTPRQVAEQEPIIRRLCTEIIDRVCERGSCDFVWDIAAPLPLLLIADMLGFERDAYDDLLRWSDDLIRGTTVNDEVARRQGRRGRAGVPRVPARGDRRPASEATPAGSGQHPVPRRDRRRAPRRRVAHPGDPPHPHRRRRDDPPRDQRRDAGAPRPPRPAGPCSATIPRRIETGVEELLRWVTPIKNMSRTATRDVELRGRQLHEGDQLILLYPSANRDEDDLRRPVPPRRAPRPEPPSGLRVRSPLLPRGGAGPPRAPGHVLGAAHPPARPRAGRRRGAPLPGVELHRGPGGHAGPLHAHRPGRDRPWTVTRRRAEPG